MPVTGQVQDVGLDLLGEPAAGDAEQLRDLLAGEPGLPGPQEELARLPVEHHVGDRRLRQPAVLTEPGELLVIEVAGQLGAREIEFSEIKIPNKLSHRAPHLSPAPHFHQKLSPLQPAAPGHTIVW